MQAGTRTRRGVRPPAELPLDLVILLKTMPVVLFPRGAL